LEAHGDAAVVDGELGDAASAAQEHARHVDTTVIAD
jgi:hypothetical protein